MADQKSVERSETKGDLPGLYDLREAQQLLWGLFETSILGVAICSDELRFLAINNTLAIMSGIPARDHLGRTVREILGYAATAVESAMTRVLSTGDSLLNVEITAQLPTRTEEGNWIANYLPIKGGAGNVKQIMLLVVEVTKQNKLEKVLLNLMDKLPRIRDQVICLGLRNRSESDRNESWVGALRQLEHCAQEMRSCSHLVEPLMLRLSDIALLEEQGQGVLPYPTTKASKENSQPPLNSRQDPNNGTNPLSPRERETVMLLATGKSSKEIATALGLSVKTVEAYRARTMLKLNLHSATELVRYAVRNKMIEA